MTRETQYEHSLQTKLRFVQDRRIGKCRSEGLAYFICVTEKIYK